MCVCAVCKPGVGRLELSKGIPVDVAGMLSMSSSRSQICHIGWCCIFEDLGDASGFPELLAVYRNTPRPSPTLKPDTMRASARVESIRSNAKANELLAGWPGICPWLQP